MISLALGRRNARCYSLRQRIYAVLPLVEFSINRRQSAKPFQFEGREYSRLSDLAAFVSRDKHLGLRTIYRWYRHLVTADFGALDAPRCRGDRGTSRFFCRHETVARFARLYLDARGADVSARALHGALRREFAEGGEFHGLGRAPSYGVVLAFKRQLAAERRTRRLAARRAARREQGGAQ